MNRKMATELRLCVHTDKDEQLLTVSPARGPSQLYWGHTSARTVGRKLCYAANAHIILASKADRGPALLTAGVTMADLNDKL